MRRLAWKRIVTDFFLSNYYIFDRYLLAWAFHMKDPHPSKLYHKHVFLSIQRYDFLNWLTSVHYSKLSLLISNLLAYTWLHSIFTTFWSLKKWVKVLDQHCYEARFETVISLFPHRFKVLLKPFTTLLSLEGWTLRYLIISYTKRNDWHEWHNTPPVPVLCDPPPLVLYEHYFRIQGRLETRGMQSFRGKIRSI